MWLTEMCFLPHNLMLMIDAISAHIQTSWSYAKTNGKDCVAYVAVAVLVTAAARTIFGKKGVFIVACGFYAAWYFRHSFTNQSATLISAVISLPICGFLNPLAAIPPTSYLIFYIISHEQDQRKQNTQLIEAIASLQSSQRQTEKSMEGVQRKTEENSQACTSLVKREEKTVAILRRIANEDSP